MEKIANTKTKIYKMILIMLLSGFFGYVYEVLFYRIDLGYFVNRGTTFGPWIPIYAVGGLLIMLISYRFKKHPDLVFLVNCFVTGILEYVTGYVLYEFMGTRLWDYNTEIWNWGNINGYICFRSVLFFGLSSLFLVYVMAPAVDKLVSKISEKKLAIISITLGLLFIADIILYRIIK